MSKFRPLIDFHYQNAQPYYPVFEKNIYTIINDFSSPIHFHSELRGYKPSPLYKLKHLASEMGIGEILCKNEGERFGVPAVKLLGATWAMHCILENEPAIDSFCTATDGNHGRAVAWSAKQLNKTSKVFVPKNTVASRIKSIKKEGAELVVVNGNYDEAVAAAEEYSRETNSCLIQDTSWDGYSEIPAMITSGYYTQMVEIEQQTNNFETPIDLVILQAGVGSWPSAITHFIRNHSKLSGTKIVCVEPMESDCFLESAKRNQLSATTKSQETIMAGLNCGTPSILAWEIMRKGIDANLSIDDSYAIHAMKRFFSPVKEDPHIEAGESGAAGLAGLMVLISEPGTQSLRTKLGINKTTRVLLFNTEGITDPELFIKKVNLR